MWIYKSICSEQEPPYPWAKDALCVMIFFERVSTVYVWLLNGENTFVLLITYNEYLIYEVYVAVDVYIAAQEREVQDRLHAHSAIWCFICPDALESIRLLNASV